MSDIRNSRLARPSFPGQTLQHAINSHRYYNDKLIQRYGLTGAQIKAWRQAVGQRAAKVRAKGGGAAPRDLFQDPRLNAILRRR